MKKTKRVKVIIQSNNYGLEEKLYDFLFKSKTGEILFFVLKILRLDFIKIKFAIVFTSILSIVTFTSIQMLNIYFYLTNITGDTDFRIKSISALCLLIGLYTAAYTKKFYTYIRKKTHKKMERVALNIQREEEIQEAVNRKFNY